MKQLFKKIFNYLKFKVLIALALLTVLLIGSYLIISSPLEDVKKLACSKILLDRNGKIFHVGLSDSDEWLIPVALKDINPLMAKVAVQIEDKRFYQHNGVDYIAIGRAFLQNLKSRKVVSGASTITVQLVRLSQPKSRSYFNKYVEFIKAIKLEKSLSKDEIMELYLNRAPFGGNIRGVEAASWLYFNKSSKDIALSEASLLVAILRGPSIYRPDKYPQMAETRRNFVLDLLKNKNFITSDELNLAKLDDISGRKGEMPRLAWHYSQKILAQIKADTWQWPAKNLNYGLQTSLDIESQKDLEARLNLALVEFPNRVTAAGIVLDNNTQNVLAYVGNQRLLKNFQGQWVDCGSQPRSPGSTLKPFLYYQAFNKKLLSLDSLLADTPISFAGQAPRNFSLNYKGAVNASTALSDSLNAPAVRVLRLVGEDEFIELLRYLGFNYINQNSKFYGDSLILGGCEVNMWQLAKAYAILARAGENTEINILNTKQTNNNSISAPAVWLTNKALRNEGLLASRLKLNREAFNGQGVAYKTGTSHGFRDAWLAAYSQQHTVVLWAGDPSGKGHPKLIGFSALATPAAYVMKDLSEKGGKYKNAWYEQPAEVEEFKACSVSGEPQGPSCPLSINSYRLKDGAKSHPCTVHVRQMGLLVVNWPHEISDFILKKEAYLSSGKKLSIISPLNKSSIILNGKKEKTVKLPLNYEGGEGNVYWFVNGKFLKEQNNLVTPIAEVPAGLHEISLLDAKGRTAKINFEVLDISLTMKETISVLNFK